MRVKGTWFALIACFVALYAYLPVAAFFDWARFFSRPDLGSRLLPTLGSLVVFWAGIHFVLVGPFLGSGFLSAQAKPNRLVVAGLIWALPLGSLAYWWGDFKTSLHAYDLGILVLTTVSVPLILFWRTGNRFTLSVGMAIFGAFPALILDDLLGSFSPLWVFAADGSTLYTVRTVGVALALVCAATYPLLRPRVSARQSVLRFVFLLLSTLSFLVYAGETLVGHSAPRLFAPDLNWVGYLGLVYYLRRGDAFGKNAYVGVSLMQFGYILAQFLYQCRFSEGGWDQSRVLLTGLGLAAIGSGLQGRLHTRPRVSRPRNSSSAERAYAPAPADP